MTNTQEAEMVDVSHSNRRWRFQHAILTGFIDEVKEVIEKIKNKDSL
jgi:hypothetical protein